MAEMPWGFFAAQIYFSTSPENAFDVMPVIILSLIAVALAAMQVLLGGTYSVFSIPCYGIIALAGISGWFGKRGTRLLRASHLCLLTSASFFGYIAIRAILSKQDYIARADLYLVLAALIIYLSFALFINSSRHRVQFVAVVLVLATVDFIIGGIQYFKGHNFMPFQFLPRRDFGGRASGFFGNPNHLAGFLEIAMLFALSLACWSRYSLVARIVAGYGAVTCAVGILLTGSRGGYASSIAGLVAFGLLSLLLAGKWLQREFWYALLALTITATGGVALAVRSALQQSDYLQFRVESVNMDVGVRTALAKAAVQQFKLSPWFGTGSRTYLFFGRQFRVPMILTDPVFAHNDYAQLLGEYGLVGFGGFCLFLAVHLKNGWKSLGEGAAERAPVERRKQTPKRSGKGSRSRSAWRVVDDEETKRPEQHRPAFKGSNSLALTAASLSSVAAYMVHSLADFNLHIPSNACLMAFVFSILANPGAAVSGGQGQHHELGAKWNPILRSIPAALGLWLLVAAVPKWRGEYYGDKARRLLSDWRFLDSNEIATEAMVMSRNGLKHDPRNPELYYYLGESQVTLAIQASEPAERTRLYEESIVSYRNALQLSPRDVRYALCHAWSLDALGRFDEAEDAFALVLELDPNSNKVHSSYAAHFHQQGKLEQAEVEYARALELGHLVDEDKRLQAIRKEIEEKKAEARTPQASRP